MAAPASPRLDPLPAEQWDESIQPLLSAEGPGGVRLGEMHIFATLARHPKLFRDWLRFGGRLLAGGELPPRDRELLILRTAVHCRAEYEWGQHVRIGQQVGLEPDEIERVADGPDAEGWEERDALLLRAADELHENSVLSAQTWSALEGIYDERQLIELPLLVGQYHMVAFALNSLGVQPEEGLEPLPSR